MSGVAPFPAYGGVGVVVWLIDVSKTQLGRFALHVEEVDLATLVKNAVDRFADQLALAHCPVELTLDSDVCGRFERAVSATHISGMGLGLYIATKIAVAHGG